MEKINTKTFTILLSISYISGIAATFCHYQKIFALLLFILSSVFIFFFNSDIKKILILYFIFLFGILRVENLKTPDIFLALHDSKEAELSGYVVSSEDLSEEKKRMRFYLKTDKALIENKLYDGLDSKVLIWLSFENEPEINPKIGDYVKVKGKLTKPTSTKNPYRFDYVKYLLNNDCACCLFAKTADYREIGSAGFSFDIIKNFETDKLFVLRKFEILREDIIKRHSKYIKSPRLEILAGIVFGNETINPDEKIQESFRNSGLLHLLAASGLNVALIFGIWHWLSSAIYLPYNLRILTGAVLIVCYCFMTGFPPSILRAGIMLLFVLFGKMIDRNANTTALLFFVAFLILLFSPKMLFDIGFQLSFAATSGLVVIVNPVIEKFKNLEKNYIEK